MKNNKALIPFIIAYLVNQMQAGCGMDVIVNYGIQLVVMAVLSLIFGVAAGNTCATASTGFARNLRKDMFYHIQDYSFENIDKFSVSSLVTRMTTDVVNVQMSFMMIIRVAIRGPLMLIFSFVMGFVMGGRLAMIFLVTIPLLSIGLVLVIRAATPIFRRVFRKYDALNDSVQENVQAMRVVKSYVREEYEKKKFAAAADDVCRDFTRAERIMALNNPMMQFCVYSGMAFVLSFGSYAVIFQPFYSPPASEQYVEPPVDMVKDFILRYEDGRMEYWTNLIPVCNVTSDMLSTTPYCDMQIYDAYTNPERVFVK